ncbi:MAG: UDP-N-acetylmuramoyl-tripeptide--D-alanyl-D-alanine ligase [Steroidobacteraceae bacterium]
MKRQLQEFARLAGGTLHGGDRPYTQVSSDTRQIASGDLFVALRGPRFDGHEFMGDALSAGAAGALVDRQQRSALPQIVVGDTQAALTRAASGWRAQFSHPLIGVAGSNGKTTVKEMLAAILSQVGSCLATRGNLNNHIGVPLTLLSLQDSHRFAVIEIGANRSGEVAALAEIARPDIGLITNAGAEHLEGFGSLDGVAHAEGEMVAALSAGGCAIINMDDSYADLWRGMTRAQVVGFGLSASAQYRAEDVRVEIHEHGFRMCFLLVAPGGRQPVELQLGGRHNVINALAAAAAAVSAGASLGDVAAGLASMRAVPGRLQLKRTRHGAQLIDDSYNANPSSMRAGIDVLADLHSRKWLVLGDMGELGEHARVSHAQVGQYAREHGIERLFATGKLATLAVEGFGAGGEWFPDTESLSRALDAQLGPDVCLLVKGSRSARLERVVAALTGKQEASH